MAGHQSRTSSFVSSYTTSPHLVSSSDTRATTSAYGVSAGAVGDDSFAAAGRPARSSSYAAPSSTAVWMLRKPNNMMFPATAYGDFVSPYKEHARQSGSNPSQISSVAGNKTIRQELLLALQASILCLLLQLDPKRHRRKVFLRVHIPLARCSFR